MDTDTDEDEDVLRTCVCARNLLQSSAKLSPELVPRAHSLASYYVHRLPDPSSLASAKGAAVAAQAAHAALAACGARARGGPGAAVRDPPRLPLDCVAEAVATVVRALPQIEAFHRTFWQPQDAAENLAPTLVHAAAKFCADAAMSAHLALAEDHRAVAAAAVVLATLTTFKDQCIEVPDDAVIAALAAEAGGLTPLRRCIKGILEVFRAWRDSHLKCGL